VAVDYRDPALAELGAPIAPGEAEFVRVSTRLFVDVAQDAEEETTVMVSFSLDQSALAGTGGWQDDLTQTRVEKGRGALELKGDLLAWKALVVPAQWIFLNVQGRLSVPAEQVRQFALWLRDVTTAPVVVIGGDLTLRLLLQGVAGFVEPTGSMSQSQAIGLTAAVHSAVSAPHRMRCVDIEWVLSALGSAVEPAVFVQGVWRRQPVEMLALTGSTELLDVLARAERVILMPSAHILRPAEVAELATWFRRTAQRADLELICSLAADHPSSDSLSPEFGTLSLLISLARSDDKLKLHVTPPNGQPATTF
jgi:hypothetical protein